MMNESEVDELIKHLRDLQKENEILKQELERERNEKEIERKKKEEIEHEKQAIKEQKDNLEKEITELKEQLAKLKGSLPILASSDKTAEAVGVPSSKIFFKQDRSNGKKRHTGGQPGHKGYGRKRPIPNAPPLQVYLNTCPICGNPVGDEAEGAKQERTVTDIPPPQHVVYQVIYHRYPCNVCKKLVRGELPWLPPNDQFGPLIACWIAYHRMLGLTLGKIQSSALETFRLSMCEAVVLKLEKWVADVLQDDYEKIKEEVRKANAVGADETPFRIGGGKGWLWVFTQTLASLYIVAPTRGHTVPEETLKGFKGTLGRDAWKPYDGVDCSAQQLDLIHVNRWLERAEINHNIEPRTILSSQSAKSKIEDIKPPERFVEFVDGVRSIMKRAIEFSEKDHHPPLDERKKAREGFEKEILALLNMEWKDKDIIRISKELRKRLKMLFTFVEIEGVPWHNNDAERAIRKGVLARKISGGRRTWAGAGIFQVLLSVSETAKKKGQNFIELAKKRMGVFSSLGAMPVAISS